MTIKEYIELLKETYNEAKAPLLMMLPLFILLIAVSLRGHSLSGLVTIVGGVFLGMLLALLFLYYAFYIYDKL